MRTFPTAVLLCALASSLLGALSCRSAELEQLRNENAELQSEVQTLEAQVQEYRDALQEANDAITQAADDISQAQAFAYGDCESLQIAVQGMDEPQEVPEP
jgi:peptidoglycan hydrolase CwlO-like protein